MQALNKAGRTGKGGGACPSHERDAEEAGVGSEPMRELNSTPGWWCRRS